MSMSLLVSVNDEAADQVPSTLRMQSNKANRKLIFIATAGLCMVRSFSEIGMHGGTGRLA
jgi:hypothetical protein